MTYRKTPTLLSPWDTSVFNSVIEKGSKTSTQTLNHSVFIFFNDFMTIQNI
jgi:hypothetical protein